MGFDLGRLQRPGILLFLILLLHVLAWFFLHPIMPEGTGDDPEQYIRYANQVFTPAFHLGFDQYQNRPGLYVPLCLFFKCFGVNAYTVSLVPLLLSLLTIILTYLFLSKVSTPKVGLLASFLIAVNIEQVTYALELYPDLPVAFYAAAVAMGLYYAREKSGHKKRMGYFLPVMWIAGFLTKETMLITLPFIFLVGARDLYKKEHSDFWKPAILCSVVCLLGLGLMYYVLTGNPFHRLHSMHDFVSNKIDSEDVQAVDIKSHNSSFLPAWINSSLYYVFILLMAVPVIVKSFSGAWSAWQTYMSRYVLYLLLFLSVLYYHPQMGYIYMQSRHWMFIIVPLSALAAFGSCYPERKSSMWVLLALSGLCVCNLVLYGPVRGFLFGLFLTAGVGNYCFYHFKQKTFQLLLIPFFILLVYFIEKNSNFREANTGRREQIKNPD
jgi:4-amino-4-deoxy-L-arabinose transferase-like glycosyltransferase